MRNATLRSLSLACAVLTLHFAACESGSSKSDAGDVHMALDVAGVSLGTISYVVTGPASFTKTGLLDVSHSATITGDVGGLPAGTGFSIALNATSIDGGSTCTGSQGFDIVAHQTTSVTVHLVCKVPTKVGSVSFNGALNLCPEIDAVGSTPSEVFVGGTVALSGLAHDSDGGPSPLSYAWTVSPTSAGTFGSPAAQSSTFVCAVAGTVSITLSVSDGDGACVDTQTIPVICTAPTGAGGSGGSATGGVGGATGGSGGSATGGSGGGAMGGSGGATGGSGGIATSGAGGATGGSGGSATGGSGGAMGGAGGAAGAAGGSAGATGGAGVGGVPDLVLYRVGDGSTTLAGTGNPVFIDGFSTAGALVSTTPVPAATSGANHPLIASGTASSEGLITRSTDGKYVLFAGYGVTPGSAGTLTGTTSAAVPRIVGRLDAAGNLDTTTALTDFSSGGSPRAVASPDGVNLWLAGGAGGARYATFGGTTSVQLSTSVTNLRAAEIFGGQLYVSSMSGAFRLSSISTGLPTTAGQTITNLPGFSTSTGSPYAFFFADLDGSAGVDTVYVADDSSGVTKYSLVSGSWSTSNGTVGSGSDAYRGITGVVANGTVTLYLVRKGGTSATGGGELATISDASGFGGAFSGTPTLLATAATGTSFRGVALAPTP
jgi:hypothetical protein